MSTTTTNLSSIPDKVERSLTPNETIKSALTESLVNIAAIGQFKDMVTQKINEPFNVSTPKEKVKKRPDGFDYVEGTWMDHVAKQFMPLYEYTLLHVSTELGWINMIVSLKDRITGNIELGAGAARIQVRQGVETPGFRDVIDMGNNIKSALTQAIKNAQSRFGVAADVYGKRESTPSDDERTRFQSLEKEIEKVSPSKARLFKEQWNALGTDFTEFLDRWTLFLPKKKEEKKDVQEKPILNL